MTLLRRFFSKRPPDGLLEFVERVYVFDSCFSTEVLPLEMYSIYLHGISNELHEEFPESSFLAFNFREGEKRSLFAEILCEYDITVLDYPRQYEGCPLLPLSLIQHFLHVCDSWLSRSNQQNIVLLHCERGGWPVLAFLLASFLIFRKLHSGERRTLELVHREAPKGLLQLLSPLNPLPSQLRYLQYVSRRNIAPEWPPPERGLSLDCIILRSIPSFDLQNGCRPVIRIFGNNLQRNDGLSTDMLFSMCKKRKSLRYYRQAECDVIKIDIQCLVRGDVVLEVVHLDLDSERELMMFRVMFNTAFIRSNILMLNSENLDILWDSKERYPKGFCAEVLFGDVESISPSIAPTTILNGEEKGGLPIEAFSRVQELFSGVDWIDKNDDAALWLLKRLSALNDAKELSRLQNRGSYYASSVDSEEESNAYSATDSSDEASDTIYKPWSDQTQSPVIDPISAVPIPVEGDNVNQIEFSSVTSEQNILQVLSKEAHQSTSLQLLAIDHVSSRPPPPPPPAAAAEEVLSMAPRTACATSMASVPGPLNAVPYNKNDDAATPSLPHPPVPPPPPPLPSYGPSRNSQIEPPTTSKSPPASPPLPCSSGCPKESFQNSTVCQSSKNINKSLSTSQPPAPPPPPPPPPLLPTTSRIFENEKLESSLLATNQPLPPSALNSSKGPPPPPPPLPNPINQSKGPFSSSSASHNSYADNHSSLRVVSQPPPPPPPPSTCPTSLANTLTAPPPPPPPCPPSLGHGQIGSVSAVRPLASKVPTAPPPPPSRILPPPPIPSKVPGPPPPPPPPIPSKVPGAPPPPPIPSKVPTAPPPPRASRVLPTAPPPPSGVPPPPPIAPKVPTAPPSASGSMAEPTADSGVKSNVPPPPFPSAMKGKTSIMNGRVRASVGATIAPKKASLKPLHWVKVTRAVQGSLWADSQKQENQSRAPEIDMSELEKYFSAASLADGAGSNKLGTRPASNMNKPEKVQLVDLNRAKNCEIMLTKIKIPLPSMVNAILALDSSVLDIDQVENLIKFCPTKEEMGLLKNYTGDKEMLGKCEKFFLELMKVPRVESKLRVFAFRITFASQVDDLRSNLNTINFSVKEVKESVKLRQIMQTILTLGNALNQGTARGSAVGFKLDSLLKLSDTRARNNKMTLMHYLCKLLSEKLPELLDFEKDLVHLEPASKIQLKTLAEEMQAVSKGLEKVEQELAASENDGAISAGFQKVLKNFLDTAEAEVRSLIGLYSEVGRNADSLSQYFGEDPARCPFEQVTQILAVFVKTFNKAREENERLAEAEKKKMEKEALKERSMGTRKGVAETHEPDLSSHLRKHAHSIQSEKHAS